MKLEFATSTAFNTKKCYALLWSRDFVMKKREAYLIQPPHDGYASGTKAVASGRRDVNLQP